ncbi:MAG: VOC family protein [Prevotella sp.]|nr:VOC family protein [Prevotella sp.]
MLDFLRFHHIGFACFDIDESKVFYEKMGYQASVTMDDPLQDTRVCFLKKEGMPYLELISPIDEKSPVNRLLQAQGVMPYHICYEVDDIELTMQKLRKEQKFILVTSPKPACAIDNRRVAFMFRKDVGLIELVESS